MQKVFQIQLENNSELPFSSRLTAGSIYVLDHSELARTPNESERMSIRSTAVPPVPACHAFPWPSSSPVFLLEDSLNGSGTLVMSEEELR